MTPETWRRCHELAEVLLEVPASELTDRLRELEAREPPAVVAGVGRLLRADRECGEFLETPLVDLRSPAPTDPEVGDRIGPHEIVGILGRGGMGLVCEAVRREPYHQVVAIKLGPASVSKGRESARRFRRERQILARLDHPGIARILDGGSWRGRPYLVMEKVDGERLDVHCERRDASLAERLRIVVEICEAVDCAHRHLVVHRDLKPANILVDAEGHPTVLDFGVAKLLEPDAELAGLDVTVGPGFLTPTYASPEQLRGEPVTTASDVYSLGTILYELIAGRRPRSFSTLRPCDVEAALAQPPRPLRGSRPAATGRRADADLDAILERALAGEQGDRYPSAARLAEDLCRWLAHRPVEAVRSSWLDRGVKLARRQRRRIGVAAAALVVLGILAFQQWKTSSELAREQRTAARNLDSLAAVLASLDPLQEGDRQTSLREALRSISLDATGSGRTQRTMGEILTDLGTLQKQMGDYESAERLLLDAVDVWRRRGDEAELTRSLLVLGRLYTSEGDFGAAIRALDEARALGRDTADPVRQLEATASLVDALRTVRDLDRARRLARQLETHLELLPSEAPRSPALSALAGLAYVEGDYAEAEIRARQALQASETRRLQQATEAGSTWTERQNLARILLARRGPVPEVGDLLDSLARDLPPSVETSERAVALAVERARWARALGASRRAESGLREIVPASATLGRVWEGSARLELARALIDQDRFEEAQDEIEILSGFVSTLPPGHSWRALAQHEAGRIALGLGALHDALSHLRRSRALWAASLGPEHPSTAETELALARVLVRTGAPRRAAELREHASTVLRRHLLPGHPTLEGLDGASPSDSRLSETGSTKPPAKRALLPSP